MALRICVRRRIRRYTQNAKAPKLIALGEAKSLIFLTQLQGNEAVNLLNRLQNRFPAAVHLTLINLNKEDKLTSLNDGRRTLIETGKKNLTIFGDMSKSLAMMVKSISAEALVNTDNRGSDLLHLIAASLHADLKCGMVNPFDLPLYNPLITTDVDWQAEDYIDTVDSYLISLTGKKSNQNQP
jgi:hypothetical protein